MGRRLPMFYSALLLTGVNLVLRFAGTTFQVYLSRQIGAAGIGLLQLTMSVGNLAMVAGIGGIRTAAMYLAAEELGKGKKDTVASVLSGCFLYSLICSGIVGGLLFWFAPALAEGWIGDIRTVSALRLFAAFLPTTCLCGVLTGYFTAANRIGTLAAVEVAEQICSMTVTMLVLIYWAKADAGRACMAVVFGAGCGGWITLGCLMLLRIREHAGYGIPIPTRKRIMDAAIPLALADILRSGISTTENLMVPKRLSLYPGEKEPLAAYGMLSGMVFPIMMFPACILFGLSELLIPELARCAAGDCKKRIDYLVQRSLKVTMLYGLLIGGSISLLADVLSVTLYKNAEAGRFLRYYAIMIPFLYCDMITDAMTKGLGQQKICVRYNILTSIMDVILLFLMLPKWGMQGYFVSFLITHLLNFGLSLGRLCKITGFRIPFYVPALAVSATLLARCIASVLHQPIMQTVLFTGILTTLLFLFQIITKKDVLWTKGLLKGSRQR